MFNYALDIDKLKKDCSIIDTSSNMINYIKKGQKFDIEIFWLKITKFKDWILFKKCDIEYFALKTRLLLVLLEFLSISSISYLAKYSYQIIKNLLQKLYYLIKNNKKKKLIQHLT